MAANLTRTTCIFLLAFILLLPPDMLLGEPYIAFREGYKCSTCHVNKTGGGKRNEFGALYTQTDITPLMQEASDRAMDFSPQIGPSISLGADLMAVHEVHFAVDKELEGKTYKKDGQNSFDIHSGNLYLEADLIPEVLSLYLDENVTPSGASSREAFLLLQSLPNQTYLKAGRILLPYGIRVWDDGTFIREATGFNFDNQDLGVEIGIEPGNMALSVALSNGTQGSRDRDSNKQLSSVGTIYIKNVLAGGSFSLNNSQGVKRVAWGPYAGLRLGPLTLLSEADWVRDSGRLEQNQFIFFTSLNYWYQQSVNLRVAFDFLNPYDDLEEDERSRVTLGLNAFLTPYLETSATYRMSESIPQDIPGNADTFTLALHSFF